jgi:CheY-like chemotaxis protein
VSGRARRTLLMPTVALVVDDSMLIRYTVCRFLEARGFVVESASNGADAMQVLARVRPGLIVTDLHMPKMSGGELITAVRGNPETETIPIIVVASRGSGQTVLDDRADFEIYKDIDIEEQLQKALQSVLGGRTRKGQTAAK